MPYSACQQQRIDSGLCMTCGQRRLGPDATKIRCAACHQSAITRQRERRARLRATQTPEEKQVIAAKKSRYNAALYASQKQSRCCTVCGRRLQGADYLNHKICCSRCRETARTRENEARRRKRRETSLWAGARNGDPLPVGVAVRVNGVRRYTIGLDSGALRALRELKKRDREARLRQSKDGKVEVVYQISRIVRDALRSWADIRECPTRTASYRQMIECEIVFCADAQTVAAVERHKAARGGNLSATVCDLLVATAKRSTVAIKRNAPRLSAGGGTPDPWNEE